MKEIGCDKAKYGDGVSRTHGLKSTLPFVLGPVPYKLLINGEFFVLSSFATACS